MDAMIKQHTEALALIDKQLLPRAQSAAVKQHLTSTRSHVASHLEEARRIRGTLSP